VSNPLTILKDGLTGISIHWQILLAILLMLIASQILLYFALKRIFGDRLAAEEFYSLSLAGWLLPASLLSLLWYTGKMLLSPGIDIPFAILILLACLVLFVRQSKGTVRTSQVTAATLLLLTALFIVLRFAFISRALMPLYFDSAQHYLFARDILSSTTWSLANYYHLGFHFLTAFFASLTHAKIYDVMLALGQVFLATMPFSMFFLVRHWTGSNGAGIFALLIAAFGWYMPAHAMDWGKYPALSSLALIPFVLGLAPLSIQSRNSLSDRSYWSLNAILFAGLIVSVFLHSRALIVFAILTVTWVLATLWQRMPGLPKLIILILAILILFGEILFIRVKGILGPLFDPYSPKGLFITSIVFILTIFAYRRYPALIFSCIVSTIFLLASLFVPLADLIPAYVNTTLLDRPFVEMILYVPLTLLGGFGLAGLEGYLESKNIHWSRAVSILFIALVVVNASFKYDIYPSDCCDIVSSDDLIAIDWMDKNLPTDARILTSSTDLNVLPTKEFQGSAGGDAGTWINPLIRRVTLTMSFVTDFSQRQTLDTLCQSQVDYVYVGKTGWPFNDAGMSSQPDAYNLIFELPNAKVYEVTGCN
jgi:hypothetical protein